MTIADLTAKPAFYIFMQEEGRARCIGAAFRHKAGSGYSLVIHRRHYLALMPKANAGKGERDSIFLEPARPAGLRCDFNRKSQSTPAMQHATTPKGKRHDRSVRTTL